MKSGLLFAMITGLASHSASLADDVPEQKEGPIRIIEMNGGKLAHRYLEDKRGSQDFALWIHNDTKVVKGVLFHLHNGSEAFRTDWQAWCKTQDFALMGSLIRWADFEKVLPDQLSKVGKRLGHPEVANVPWACIGGSRNVGALLNFTRLHPDGQNQMLALLFNGGPGIGLQLDGGPKSKPKKGEEDPAADVDDKELFNVIPIMAVNGSADPFVGQMAWQKSQYPKIRKHNMPYGVAVDWDCGHSPEEGPAMWFPFVKAVAKVRIPNDADPTKGKIKLKPFTYEQGWLVGPVDWEDEWGPRAAPVKKWEGSTKGTVWLPDENCVRVWQSMVSQVDDVKVNATPSKKKGAGTVLTLSGPGAAKAKDIVFHSDEQIAVAKASNPADWPITKALDEGGFTVWAEFTDVDGKRKLTQPIIVCDGKYVDWRKGAHEAHLAKTPMRIIQLSDEQKATLQALEDRRKQADVWKVVFEETFDGKRHKDWYNYYMVNPRGEGPRRGHEEDRQTIVDGAMQLTSKLHAVAMLPYDWPENVMVEYRAKAVSQRICDLSVVLSGNPGGTDFPWREGMMYQFGAHFNQGSFFLVREQPHKNWKEYDSGARVVPGKWHSIKVERLGNTAKAWVDGKLQNTREISDTTYDKFYGQKIGLYTFQSTAQFDDFKVSVRGHSNPDAVKPALPSDEALNAVAARLIELMSHDFGEQRQAAWRLLRSNSFELADSMKDAMEAAKIENEDVKRRIERIIAGKRPG